MAWAEEWEKMTGAAEVARASRAVCTEVCDRSTISPSLFISFTTVCREYMSHLYSQPLAI